MKRMFALFSLHPYFCQIDGKAREASALEASIRAKEIGLNVSFERRFGNGSYLLLYYKKDSELESSIKKITALQLTMEKEGRYFIWDMARSK